MSIVRVSELVRRFPLLLLGTLVFLFMQGPAFAGSLTGLRAGPYRVDLWTEPANIPVGKARLHIRLTDQSSIPLSGGVVRVLVKMPTMDMGEREEKAVPDKQRPGIYVAPVAFAMAGDFVATVQMDAGKGPQTLTANLATGQMTMPPGEPAEAGRNALPGWVVPTVSTLALLGLFGFIAIRTWQTRTPATERPRLSIALIVALVILIVAVIVSRFAIQQWRAPGAMTPVEAQAMNMAMPPPAAPAPVELDTVKLDVLESTVRYTGQVAGFVEQDVSVRVGGWITSMSVYVGDRVRAGQVLAQLDTTQTGPQATERAAQESVAREEVTVSQSEHRVALAEARRMRSEAKGKREALVGAEAERIAMRRELESMEAELASDRTMVDEAEAERVAATADRFYWDEEIRRMQSLLDKGAVSREEFQRESAMAAAATARLRATEAGVIRAKEGVRAAEARRARAQSLVALAESRVRQMRADAEAAGNAVAAAEAEVATAQARIRQMNAGVRGAQAARAGADVLRGYSIVRAPVDGVITERFIAPGTLVNPGQALLRIAQIQPVRLQVNIPETDRSAMVRGARVRVWSSLGGGASGKDVVAATITAVSPLIDPATRMGLVEAVYPNKNGRFLPGQSVVMEIVTGPPGKRSLLVSVHAVQWESTSAEASILSHSTRAFVWRVADDGSDTVQRVAVVTAQTGGGRMAILSGLKEGERVVTRGQENLRDGDRVQTVPWGASGPSALPRISEPKTGTGGEARPASGHPH